MISEAERRRENRLMVANNEKKEPVVDLGRTYGNYITYESMDCPYAFGGKCLVNEESMCMLKKCYYELNDIEAKMFKAKWNVIKDYLRD